MPRRIPQAIQTALDNAGAVLIRQVKHYIYRLPNGQKVTISGSASDHRAIKNAIATIRRAATKGTHD